MLKKFGILIATVSLLSGCSLISPVNAPQTTYMINSTPHHVLHSSGRAGTLMVATPKTSTVYNTADMAYSTYPHQIAYFAKNVWAAQPAEMLKPLIVETLQKTHHFKAVTSSELSSSRQYSLYTQILQLEQVYSDHCKKSTVHLRVQAMLVKSATGEVIATRNISVIVPAPQNTPYGYVIAANRATTQMLKQLAAFCVRKT